MILKSSESKLAQELRLYIDEQSGLDNFFGAVLLREK